MATVKTIVREAYSVREFAQMVSLSERSVFALIAAGKLKSITIGGCRTRRILREHVDEFLGRDAK